jgi:hypothetical protein
MISRRTLLGAGLLSALPVSARAKPARQLQLDVATFAAFGEQRAGSEPARRTAAWLVRRFRTLGYEAQLHPFPVTTLTEPWVRVATGGQKIAGFIQWLPPGERWPESLTGPLIDLAKAQAEPGCLALISKPAPLSAYWPASLDQAIAAAVGAGAIILAVDDPLGGLFAYNRDAALPRLPLPVVIVDKAGMTALASAAMRGERATIRGAGVVRRVQALNCRASLPGGGRKIVISTPLTGWFRCGAERGAGIAVMLSLAQALRQTGRPIELVATGAHEIGHLGMQQAIASGVAAPKDVAIWCHLGASLGATALDGTGQPPSVHFLMASQPEHIALGTFADTLGLQRLPATRSAPGEAGDVIRGGFENVLAFTGVFPGFHTPGDDGRAIDFDRLDAYSRFLGSHLLTYQ